MKDKEFMKLVEPVSMLIGYCQSASDLTPKSNMDLWKARLIVLADEVAKVWDEVVCDIGESQHEYSGDKK